MRCSEASEGELCPNSTWDRKLAEKPVRLARARTVIFRAFLAALSRGPSCNARVLVIWSPVKRPALLDADPVLAYRQLADGRKPLHSRGPSEVSVIRGHGHWAEALC